MSDRRTTSSTTTTPTTGGRVLSFLRRYWLPLLLTVLAVIFILQNRRETRIDFLFLHLTTPLWLTLTIVCLVGVVIGWFAGRRR